MKTLTRNYRDKFVPESHIFTYLYPYLISETQSFNSVIQIVDVSLLYIICFIPSLTPFGSDLRSSRSHKFNIAHLEDSRQQLEHISDLLLGEFHHFQGLLQRSTDKARQHVTTRARATPYTHSRYDSN